MPKQPVMSAEEPRSGVDSESPRESDGGTPPGPEAAEENTQTSRPKEYGGPKGPEPVRYGDWEKNGRCIDF